MGKLIEGLEMGIYTMKRQEKASFVIDWKYAYGGQGKSILDFRIDHSVVSFSPFVIVYSSIFCVTQAAPLGFPLSRSSLQQ